MDRNTRTSATYQPRRETGAAKRVEEIFRRLDAIDERLDRTAERLESLDASVREVRESVVAPAPADGADEAIYEVTAEEQMAPAFKPIARNIRQIQSDVMSISESMENSASDVRDMAESVDAIRDSTSRQADASEALRDAIASAHSPKAGDTAQRTAARHGRQAGPRGMWGDDPAPGEGTGKARQDSEEEKGNGKDEKKKAKANDEVDEAIRKIATVALNLEEKTNEAVRRIESATPAEPAPAGCAPAGDAARRAKALAVLQTAILVAILLVTVYGAAG